MRILMIEDDARLAQAVAISLTRAGYQAELCMDGKEGLQLALNGAYDILMVDRMLPGLSGTALVAALRAANVHTPVLMITALDGIGDRVDGLDAGADDYLTKPFAVEELLARLRALARRPVGWTQAASLDAGDLSLDLTAKTLVGPAGECVISVKECTLLEVFLRGIGRTYPRQALFARVWGANAPVEDGNLDSYVHFLRRRLKGVGSTLRIQTVYGVGYRLEESDV